MLNGLALRVDVGTGPIVVLLPGFGLPPAAYSTTARHVAEAADARVLVPELYRVRGRWRFEEVVERLAIAIDGVGADRVTMIGHSFSGGVELRYACENPSRIEELVFVDTLAVSREWRLAEEAASHPMRLLRLATPSAAIAFLGTALGHPAQVLEAAWFGFTSGRVTDADDVPKLGLRAHVLWANRDSLLRRSDGEQFARDLHASFTVVDVEAPVDHDWLYRHPQMFIDQLRRLDLELWDARERAVHEPRRTPGG